MPQEAYADVYHYFPHPETGEVILDDEGDPMLGYYYQLVNDVGPLSHLMGPYANADEAEAACLRAWDKGDY